MVCVGYVGLAGDVGDSKCLSACTSQPAKSFHNDRTSALGTRRVEINNSPGLGVQGFVRKS